MFSVYLRKSSEADSDLQSGATHGAAQSGIRFPAVKSWGGGEGAGETTGTLSG